MPNVSISLDTCMRCDSRRVEAGDQVKINLDPDKFSPEIIEAYSPITGAVTEVRLPTTSEPASAAMVIEVDIAEEDLPPGFETIDPCDILSVSCYDCCASLTDRVTTLEESSTLNVVLQWGGPGDDGAVPSYNTGGYLYANQFRTIGFGTVNWASLQPGLAVGESGKFVLQNGAFTGTIRGNNLTTASRIYDLPNANGTLVLGDGSGVNSPAAFRLQLQVTDTALIDPLNILQYPSIVTGLTGGGASKLDGISTVALAAGTKRAVYISDQVHVYELEAAATAEDSPFFIRPDDYNGVTNVKVWRLQGLVGTGLFGQTVTGQTVKVEGSSGTSHLLADNLTIDRNHQLPTDAGVLAITSNNDGSLTGENIIWEQSNGDASAGILGEYFEVVVDSGTVISLTTAVVSDFADVALTPGDWDVEAQVVYVETAATVTSRSAGINTAVAIPTDGSEVFDERATTTTTQRVSLTLSRKRYSLAANTTVKINALAAFSAGTVDVYGKITARRAR